MSQQPNGLSRYKTYKHRSIIYVAYLKLTLSKNVSSTVTYIVEYISSCQTGFKRQSKTAFDGVKGIPSRSTPISITSFMNIMAEMGSRNIQGLWS